MKWKSRAIPLAALAVVLIAVLSVKFFPVTTAPLPQPWQPGDIQGLSISLDNPVSVEDLRFATPGEDIFGDESHGKESNNIVVATFGQKNGYITGPVLHWKLVEGRLQVYDDSGIWDELTLLSRDSKFITVRDRAGKVEKFKILAMPAPAPAPKK